MKFESSTSINICPGVTGLLLGLPVSIFISQLVVASWSLPLLTAVVLTTAVATVWLDGILTEVGLRKGLEEANPVIDVLQSAAGHGLGLILSRLILTSLVLSITFAFKNPYPLLLVTLVFSICSLSNLLIIKNSRPTEDADHR